MEKLETNSGALKEPETKEGRSQKSPNTWSFYDKD